MPGSTGRFNEIVIKKGETEMAITYNRDEKCGKAVFEQKFRGTTSIYSADLYVGNCFLIMVREYTDTETGEQMEQLISFFVDEAHMKRCLEDGIFAGTDRLVELTVNKAKCKNWKAIVRLLTEYTDNVSITTYTEGEQNWNEYRPAQPIISDSRMRELAETALSFIYDSGDLLEFMEDRCVEFDKSEIDYFGFYGIEVDDYE
jgi:hypothetical protein